MGTIPLSYTVNVSLSGTPSGLGEFNTNSICLFTNERPLIPENYIWAVNAKEIETAFGTGSLTAKMGTALFTPVPNLRTGNGKVLVYYYDGVNATSGYLTTAEIKAAQITAFKNVTDGELTITIDAVDYTVTGMDFSAITTLADIVTVLNAQGLDCNIEVSDTTKIKFTSRRYGNTDSSIALKATVGGSGTDIYGVTLLNGANATATAGTDESGTTLASAVAEAEEIGYFGGILTTQFCKNATVLANSTAIQGLDHVYYETTQSLKNIAVLGASIKSASNTDTRLLAYSYAGSVGSKQAIATYATIAQSANYSGNDTALTMNLKTLTGIVADLNLNSTYYAAAETNGVDIYGSTEGLSVSYSFSNGDYTDDATNKLWLKKALEVSGFNYLRKTNTKIPQTEKGMTGLKNAYMTRCEQGIRNGVIGTGLKWNDSIPFGDPETFQTNIEEKGYYIYSIPIAEQQQAEREGRIAPVIQIAIKFSGAIHSSNVIVTIQK